MSDLDKRKIEYISKIENIKNPSDLSNIKSEIFGKNGFLTLEFKKLGNLSTNEKKVIASKLNEIKKELTNLLNKKTDGTNIKIIKAIIKPRKGYCLIISLNLSINLLP